MTTETMTIHKALSEIKILDNRINELATSIKIIGMKKKSSDKVIDIKVEDFKKEVVSGYDKLTSLINRRKAIKNGIIASNAVTKVNIAGTEYTVAEAIEMKNYGIQKDKMLLAKLSSSRESILDGIEFENNKIEKAAQQYISALYGTKDKAKSEEIEQAYDNFVEKNTYEIVDPLDVLKKTNSLRDHIDMFESEVDSALSVSNALTTIAIEY